MPKPEMEFFSPEGIPWEPVVASRSGGAGGAGVMQKILSRDPTTGDLVQRVLSVMEEDRQT